MTTDASQLTDAAFPDAAARTAALRAKALRAGAELEGATPQEILRWALGEFHPDLVIASSMGDAVLVDMASKIQTGVPVLFLDTGYHFAETIGTRDAVATVYPVNIVTVLPLATVSEQDAEHGRNLWQRQPDLCCALRKVEPLARGLSPYTAWASGIRRDEATTRRTIGVVEWDEKRSMVKVNPLAAWTQEQVDAYIADNGVLVNTLAYDGYPSIGCAPCTRQVAPGEDPRAGRWAGTGKTECGLHI
jgi:phosphoadenosine phosphosulfate reductase